MRFEKPVFYVESLNLFHTVDYQGRPAVGNWVVVRRLAAEELIVERFHGQPYLGVVQVLEYYPLSQLEQWKPRIHTLMMQVCGLTSSVLGAFLPLAVFCA